MPPAIVGRGGRQPRARGGSRRLAEKFLQNDRDGARPSFTDRRSVKPPSVLFHQKDTEQYHMCVGGRGPCPQRRPPVRAGDPRRPAGRLELLAPLPGGAREARPCVLGLLVVEPVHRHGARRRLRRHARGQRRQGARGDRRGAAPGVRRGGRRRGAEPCPRARQGPAGAVDGVDGQPHVPAWAGRC